MMVVNEAILDVADLLRIDARERGTAIVFDLAKSLPPTNIDPLQIQQVILNLASNGMDAMSAIDPTQRRLTITSSSKVKNVEVVVHDTGKGVVPESLGRIFDPFYSTKPHGLGVGLSLCRSIVESHGGTIWADASDEVGTAFHFKLPAAQQVSVAEENKPS